MGRKGPSRGHQEAAKLCPGAGASSAGKQGGGGWSAPVWGSPSEQQPFIVPSFSCRAHFVYVLHRAQAGASSYGKPPGRFRVG